MTLDLTQWWTNRASKLASNLWMKKTRPYQIIGLVQGHPAVSCRARANLNSDTCTNAVPWFWCLWRNLGKKSRNGDFALWHSQGTRLCPSSYHHTIKRKLWRVARSLGSRPTLKSEDLLGFLLKHPHEATVAKVLLCYVVSSRVAGTVLGTLYTLCNLVPSVVWQESYNTTPILQQRCRNWGSKKSKLMAELNFKATFVQLQSWVLSPTF